MSNILDRDELGKTGIKQTQTQLKARHWFCTLWFGVIILSNLWLALLYFSSSNGRDLEVILRISVGVLSLLKVVSIVFLLKWKKIGFYGYLISAILITVITSQSYGYLTTSIQFVISFSILVIALFINHKEIDQSAWNLLN